MYNSAIFKLNIIITFDTGTHLDLTNKSLRFEDSFVVLFINIDLIY